MRSNTMSLDRCNFRNLIEKYAIFCSVCSDKDVRKNVRFVRGGFTTKRLGGKESSHLDAREGYNALDIILRALPKNLAGLP